MISIAQPYKNDRTAINPSVCLTLALQPASQPASQLASQPASQPTSQPAMVSIAQQYKHYRTAINPSNLLTLALETDGWWWVGWCGVVGRWWVGGLIFHKHQDENWSTLCIFLCILVFYMYSYMCVMCLYVFNMYVYMYFMFMYKCIFMCISNVFSMYLHM